MEEAIEEPKWKRFLVIAIVIIALIFIIVYSVFGSVFGNLLGLFESSEINENKVKMFEDTNLVFLNGTYEELFNLYYSNLGKEFKACLIGYVEKDYFVNEIIIPEIYFQKHNEVIAAPCQKETIVDLHSHPDKHCLFSEQDKISFNTTKGENTIMAVLCEEDRFNFYR